MVFFNHVVQKVILTVLCNTSFSINVPASTDQSNNVSKKDGETKIKFIKLLNSIANMNKQRLDALDKYMYLDKYDSAKGMLRYSHGRDPVVAVLFLNKSDHKTNKLYEIYDNALKNVPGDTPVRNLLQQIKDYYDKISEKNVKDKDILEKQYSTNFHLERNRQEPSYEQEIIPIHNYVENRDFSYETSNAEEIIISPTKNNIQDREKETSKENHFIPINKKNVRYTHNNYAETSDGEEIVPSIKNNIRDKERKEPKDGKNIPNRNKILGEEINDTESSDGEEIIPMKTNIQSKETSDGEEIDSKRGRNITDEDIPNKENYSGIGKLKLTKDLISEMNKKQILRLFKSCNKEAAKACKKACKAAGIDVCERYKCSKSMKKSFRKNCAKKCKSEFSD